MLSQPVIDLLKALSTAGAPDFKKVSGAANLAVAQDELKNFSSAAFVVPLSDSAMPNALIGDIVEQHVIERFGVILAVKNLRDVRGEAVNSDLEVLRNKAISGLQGFKPASDYDPVQYGSGRILLLDVSTIWWQLEFITGYYQRSNA
jgi:hypothetical protein